MLASDLRCIRIAPRIVLVRRSRRPHVSCSRSGLRFLLVIVRFFFRCAQQLRRRAANSGIDDDVPGAKEAFLQRVKDLKAAFSALERGELGLPDRQGRFACGVCGDRFKLQNIVAHEQKCRDSLEGGSSSSEGCGAPSVVASTSGAMNRELDKLRAEISARADLDPVQADEAWRLCIDRLKAIIVNATEPRGVEKKYRRLKRRNEAFSAAIGRYQSAIRLMKLFGFREAQIESKQGKEVPNNTILYQRMMSVRASCRAGRAQSGGSKRFVQI